MPTKRVRGPDSTFVSEPAFPYLCLTTFVSFVSTLTAKKPDFFSPPVRPFSVYSSLILVLDLLWEALSIHETSSQGHREMENTRLMSTLVTGLDEFTTELQRVPMVYTRTTELSSNRPRPVSATACALFHVAQTVHFNLVVTTCETPWALKRPLNTLLSCRKANRPTAHSHPYRGSPINDQLRSTTRFRNPTRVRLLHALSRWRFIFVIPRYHQDQNIQYALVTRPVSGV